MQTAVIVAVYNKENNIARLMDALLQQSQKPDEIIIVDDGSTDGTAEIVQRYVKSHPLIHSYHQQNRGPASARNRAWRSTDMDICIFTDADCVPESDWIATIVKSFTGLDIGAVAGTYKTLNPQKIMARFYGMEIDWRYRNVRGGVDAHGSYNLAVRREVLKRVGGFNEVYRRPSGEDWDLTYKISRLYKIVFVPEAVVGHYHPEDFFWYIKNQIRRGYDRMRVYRDHPEKRERDTYTGRIVKYQVMAAGASIPSAIFLIYSSFPGACWIPVLLVGFLLATTLIPFSYFFKRDKAVAFYSLFVQFCRFYAWFLGAIGGLFRFGYPFKS